MEQLMRRIADVGPANWKFHPKARVLVRKIDSNFAFQVAWINYIKRHECIEANVGIQPYYDPRLDGVYASSRNVYREFIGMAQVKDQLDHLAVAIEDAVNSELQNLSSDEQLHLAIGDFQKSHTKLNRALLYLVHGDHENAMRFFRECVRLCEANPLNSYPVRCIWIDFFVKLCDENIDIAHEILMRSCLRSKDAIFGDEQSNLVQYAEWAVST